MAADWHRLNAALVRSVLAHRLGDGDVGSSLGEIVLAPHQSHAAARLRVLLRAHQGALLADDVGMGKTYVALAVAREYRQVLILHPAALRDMWCEALRRSGTRADLASYESLSRRTPRCSRWDLTILDEAHHARSRRTRRYPRIAALTARSHTLLLSATPVPNRIEELRALLALFLGERAWTLDAASARALVVRRRSESVPATGIPTRTPVQWIEAPDDADVVRELEALPAPISLAGDGDGRVLITYGLVRQWASSRAALLGALRRRIARASALDDLLAGGTLPTRRQLDAWTITDDVMQLPIPELLGHPAPRDALPVRGDVQVLRASVAAHRTALRDIVRLLARGADVDASRAAVLLAVRRQHDGEKVLAFTEYAATARAYWRALRGERGVALLTARGGTIASGAVSRAAILHRFAPIGQRRPPPPGIEAISLLIATDLLAEGVDLRDATVVVHLDLPWSPARLEQRAGRTRRLGSSAALVSVYALRPPHAAEALLGMEARLRRKLAVARDAVGWACDVLPRDAASVNAGAASSAELLSTLLDRLARWRTTTEPPASGCVAGVLTAPVEGWLALVTVGAGQRLLARVGGDVTDAPAALEHAIALVESAHDRDGVDDGAVITRCLSEALQWTAARAAEACLVPPPTNGVMRLVLDHLARVHAAMPHEQRAAAAALLATARATAITPHTAGVERELERITRDAALDGTAWLQAIVAAGETARASAAPAAAVEVLIAFAPAGPTTSSPQARDPATRS